MDRRSAVLVAGRRGTRLALLLAFPRWHIPSGVFFFFLSSRSCVQRLSWKWWETRRSSRCPTRPSVPTGPC